MPLFELKCRNCLNVFEDFSSYLDPAQSEDFGKCPKCQQKTYDRVISRFRIGGKGDLREFTMHGCHDAHIPHEEHSHPTEGDSQSHEGHGHDHSHASPADSGDATSATSDSASANHSKDS